jgi:two-component system, OmpR family, phosphate regulon sensor histidine kinase PhoR
MRFRRSGKPAEPPAPRRHALDTNALLAASQAVNSALGVAESLRVVLQSAKSLVEAHEGSVMLLDDDGFLRVLVSEGIPPPAVSETRIKLGEGVAGRVASTGQPLLIQAQPREGEFESFVEKDRTLTSAISVPLRAGGRTVGVLNLNLTSGGRSFTASDLQVAQIFGEQAAMAIRKTQLLEQAETRGEDLSLLFEVSKGLIGTIGVESLLTRVLDGAARFAGARAGFVCLFDEAEQRLSVGVYQGVGRDEVREVLSKPGFAGLFAGPGGPAGADALQVFAAKDRDVLASIAHDDEHCIAIPMKVEVKVRALMILLTSDPGPNRVRLLEAYSAQAGLAIRNAQLYDRLGDKEAELSSIVYSIANPIVLVDGAGRLLVANPAAEELFSFSTDFIKGRPIKGVLDQPALEALLLGEPTDPDNPPENEMEVSLGKPVPRIWKARASRIRSLEARGMGGAGGRILVLEDVTQEREMETMKADFVAVVGHELRTPLTIIKGFVKTLIRRGDTMEPEQRQEALRATDAQTQRLERLIEDLLYVSRIETSRPTLHLGQDDLVGCMEKLLTEFQGREPGRTFTLEAPVSLQMMLDRTKTEQIIYHLLDNACKYSPADAPVAVAVIDRSGEVEVKVSDRGVGIVSGEISRVFERFRQVDSSSTRERGGTGVGLYICKSLVTAQGGRIWVESVWGKGSTFSFTLPKGLMNAPKQFPMPSGVSR